MFRNAPHGNIPFSRLGGSSMVNPMKVNNLIGIQPLDGIGGTFGGFTKTFVQPQFGQNYG